MPVPPPSPTSPGVARFRLPRPVWLLGWTSFFTDTATEAIYPLLPLFLTHVLRAGAVSLGIIEGAAEATASLLKILSGRASDRWMVRRPIVIVGYGLSSAARPLIGLATSWWHVLAVRLVDRMGKGVRGAPRDALLGTWAPPGSRGYVYGFHRAMDDFGAVAGPILASLFLLAFPGRYRLLFAVTIVPGAIATGLLFLVPERPPGAGASGAGPRWGQDRTSIVDERFAEPTAGARIPRRFYGYLAVWLLFSLGNSADAFLLLRLSDVGVAAALVPLLWAAHNGVKAALSTFGGRLSDRWSRRSVITIGWIIYAIVYGAFAQTTSRGALIGWFLVYGVYYALTEGAARAFVADIVPASQRGYAFGLFDGVLGFGALGASVFFGLIWKLWGAPAAFLVGAGLALAAAVGLLVVAKSDAS